MKKKKKFKFTKEIKETWIKALESGKYIQAQGVLVWNRSDGTKNHCCLGVLGEILPELDNNIEKMNCKGDNDPYFFIKESLGEGIEKEIYSANDKTFDPNKRDYSNVLPLIKELPTED